jgi:surface glycoprotein (TIGR04207 family)
MSGEWRTAGRAVFLASVMVLSVIAGGVGFAGSATAAATSIGDFTAEDVVAGQDAVTQTITLRNVDNDQDGGDDLVEIQPTPVGDRTSTRAIPITDATIVDSGPFGDSADSEFGVSVSDSNSVVTVELDNDETYTGNITIELTLNSSSASLGERRYNYRTSSKVLSDVANFSVVGPAQADVDPGDLRGTGTETNPYVISNASELQAMEDDITANYSLRNDIIAGNTSAWNGGSGFDPVGSNTTSFTGTLDGNGHDISGLAIDRTENNLSAPVGLFTRVGSSARIEDVDLRDVSIAANRSAGSHGFESDNFFGVGALAGNSSGTVRNISVSGRVSGAHDVGGLIGISGGSVSNVSSSATVIGSNSAGGLIGTIRAGTVADVTLRDPRVIVNRSEPNDPGELLRGNGGLAGRLYSGGDVESVAADVNVTVNRSVIANHSEGYYVGGLVGVSRGSIEDVSVSGRVRGNAEVGSVVGRQTGRGTGIITDATSDATVRGIGDIGGIVGGMFAGKITNVSTDGYIDGYPYDGVDQVQSEAGGLGGVVGEVVGGTVRNASSSATINASYSSSAGGLVGGNGGTLVDVSASGYVNATPSTSVPTINEDVGGLAGTNSGTIRNASATGRVDGAFGDTRSRGTNRVGGLVGDNSGTIRNATATGRVSGSDNVGGLAGESSGAIRIATARGDVNASRYRVGGLVGLYDPDSASDTITNTSARGSVNGSERVGGLVGESRGNGINHSFAVGNVTGSNLTGGVVGSKADEFDGSIHSYWDIETTGQDSSAGERDSFQDPEGLQTSQMTGEAAETNMTELSFGTVWYTKANDYPVLAARTDPSTLFSIASASAVDATDANANVTTNDAVEVRVDIDGVVDSVTANASALGGPESLSLSDGNGDGTYNATFTVSAVSGDGDYRINVTATNADSAASAETNQIRLDTSPPVFRFDTGDGIVDLENDDGEVGDGDQVGVNITAYDTDSGLATIQANASEFGVDSVTLTEYRDGSYTGTFTVDAANASPDGSHAVSGSATNGVGQTTTDTSDTLVLNTSRTSGDSTLPVLTNASITDFGNPFADSFVNDGDRVFINVTVTDSGGSGIANVEADASGFGAGTVTLNDTDDDSVYNATFTVNGSRVSGEDLIIRPEITATDGAGNSNSTKPEDKVGNRVYLDTVPPDANLTANRTTIQPGDAVRFNASGSSDGSFRDLESIRWDFDGDGIVEQSGFFSSNSEVTYQYVSAGTYAAEVTVSDDAGNTNTTSITIDVENQAPTAADDSYTTSEDVPLTVGTRAQGVLANDTDPESDTLTATLVSGPTNGSLTLYANGSFTYTPDQNFAGTDSFTYNASDGEFNSTATVTITVSPVNDAPVARDDNYTVSESTDRSDSVLSVSEPGVLQNDSDPEGSALTATLVTGPANGTLTLYANGSFSYTPDQGFVGTDSFAYNATDGRANDTATVSINVTAVNRAPTADDDSYTTTENETLNVTDPGVLDDDTDRDDGDTLTAIVVTRPDNGTLDLNATGGFSYVPDPGFNGTDSFTYNATDGQANDTATVTITVDPATSGDSTAPTLSNPTLADASDSDGYVADGDRIAAAVTANDSGTGLYKVGVDASRFGAGMVNLTDGNGDDVYNATFRVNDTAAGSDGAVTPLFRAVDNAGNVNGTSGPSLTMDTEPPTASVTANRTSIVPGETVRFNASSSTDNLADGLARHRWDFDSDGVIDANRSFDDTATVAHAFQSNGTYAVELTVSDRANNTDTTSITIDVSETNQAPTAADDSYNTTENTTLTVATRTQGVLANDSDPDDTPTAVLVSGPANGTLTLYANGSFSYTPNQSFVGTDSFAYNATDGRANDTATVTITVEPSTSGDSTPPTLTNPSLADLSGSDRNVADGDLIGAAVKVNETGSSGLAGVWIDARRFGAGNVTLTDGNGDDVYNATFTIDDSNAGTDGSVTPVFYAADDAGNSNSTTGPSLTLDTTAPGVSIDANNTTVGVGETVEFVANADDATSSVVSYTWQLGDGTTASGPTVNHSYASTGTYAVEVTVTDDAGNTNTTTAAITVSPEDQAAPPADPVIRAPEDGIYAPTRSSTPQISYNATGVIDSGDVGIVVRNATAGNGTVVASEAPGSAEGTEEVLVPAGSLSGDVTLNVTLVNTTEDRVYASDLVNLTAVTAPAILTPANDTYDPTAETTIGTFHNADGVIAPGDVGVRLRNVTGTNDTVVANNASTSLPVVGTVNTTIPTGAIDGNVTLRAELYNTSNGTTEAAGLVNLTAPTDGDDGTDEGFAEPAPVVLVPSDGTYDPTEEFTASIGYNATGFVAPDDVEIRFRNATAGNGTVVATATPGSPSGNAGVTIPAGTFVGDVTINVTLANGTTDAVYASELVNLTAETPDDGGDSAPPAPAIFAPANATYDPDARLNFTTFHNATGVIAPSDVGVRLRNVTGTNDTVVARNTSLLVDGEADLRVEAGALDGNVTVRTELYNTSSPGATAAETITNLTVDSADAPPTAVPSVVASNVSHAGGTQPDLSNVSLHAEFSGGLLQVQLRNESYVGLNNGGEPGGNYELEGVGVDDSTRIRVNVTVANFTPRVLIGSARDVNWSRTRTADGDWTLSITGSPVEVHSYFGNNNNPPDEWTGSLTATQSQNQTITYAVDGLSTVSPTYRERLNGSVFITDAQRFGAPTYNASATPDRVELEVAAPHYETDGKTVNEGLFEAYIPPSLLDEWGVSASDLVGKFDGTRKSTTVSTTPDGGARVSFDVTYSEETAVVTYNGSDSTAPTVLAPGDSGYVPSERTNLSLDYNATGVIAPSDVEIVVRNATAGNGTIVGNATPGSVNGTTRIAIPAGTLSGDVTLNVTLVNATDRIVYASDPVTLTAETVDDGGGQEGGGEGGIALPSSPGVTLTTSDLAAETLSSLDVTFNVSGESVDASDVELWLYNASDGRELVGKTTQVGTKSGLSAVTVPADELGGGAFTAEIQVVTNSTGSPLVLANSSSIVFAYEGVSTSVGAQTVTDAEGEGIEVTYDLGNIAPENATIRLAETTIGSGLGTRSVPVSDSSGTATVEVNASELNRNATFQAYILDENRGRQVQSSISHGAVGFDGSPTPSITDASVSYANGSDVSGVEVNASFDFQHKAVDWYLHPDGQPDTREIGTVAGIDSDTRLRVNVTVENFDPLFAVGTANATDWETTQIDGNTTRITFALTPAEADWDERITNPDPREWPLVNGSATVSYDAIVDITTFSLEGQQTGRERLRGGLIASDAQAFAPPQYTLPSNGDPGALEIAVASPHYEPDGRTVSTGFYRAIIPDAIIADWGISPSQLTATYQGKRAPLTVRQLPSGGVRVFTPIGYSSGTVSVTGNTSAPQVTTFEAMNPTGRDVNLTIEVDRELDEIAVNLSGPESAVLTEADFEETQHSDGSYTYNASYAAGTDGTYEAALETAVDTSGTGITATVEDSVSVEGSTANFTASIAGTNEPVVAGETLEITATIENVGNESGTQQVSLNAGGQERDTESVQLDPGTNTTVTLSWTTAESDDGTYQATVATEHDTASTAVQVREPAFVDITIDSTNAPVVVGEHLTVTATIENTGDVSGTQTIRLSVNGTERNSTTRTLGPAESQEVQLTWNTTGVDAERYTVEVASSDDIATGTVSVQAAAANISVDSSSLSTDTITAGGTVTVTATVNNTGAVAGTETIALSAGDTQLAMQEVTIDAGNTTEITFAEYGASLDPGTYEVRVGNRSAGTLTIEESSSGTGAPGFGVGTAVGALVLVALWARRRR